MNIQSVKIKVFLKSNIIDYGSAADNIIKKSSKSIEGREKVNICERLGR